MKRLKARSLGKVKLSLQGRGDILFLESPGSSSQRAGSRIGTHGPLAAGVTSNIEAERHYGKQPSHLSISDEETGHTQGSQPSKPHSQRLAQTDASEGLARSSVWMACLLSRSRVGQAKPLAEHHFFLPMAPLF